VTRHGEAEEEASCHHRNNQNSNSHFHCLAIRRRGDTPIMTHTTKPSQSHSFLFVSFSCPIIPTLKGKKKDDSSDAFSLIQNQKMQQQKQRQEATKHSLSFYSDITTYITCSVLKILLATRKILDELKSIKPPKHIRPISFAPISAKALSTKKKGNDRT